MIYENVCMKCIASICVNWMNDDMKMRVFYPGLNGNACIKLHYWFLIFFANAGIKLDFLVLKMRMHRWMHKNSILFFSFNWKIMHACIKFY